MFTSVDTSKYERKRYRFSQQLLFALLPRLAQSSSLIKATTKTHSQVRMSFLPLTCSQTLLLTPASTRRVGGHQTASGQERDRQRAVNRLKSIIIYAVTVAVILPFFIVTVLLAKFHIAISKYTLLRQGWHRKSLFLVGWGVLFAVWIICAVVVGISAWKIMRLRGMSSYLSSILSQLTVPFLQNQCHQRLLRHHLHLYCHQCQIYLRSKTIIRDLLSDRVLNLLVPYLQVTTPPLALNRLLTMPVRSDDKI